MIFVTERIHPRSTSATGTQSLQFQMEFVTSQNACTVSFLYFLPTLVTELVFSSEFPFALSKVWYLGRNETWMQKLDYPKPNRERHDNYIIAEPNIGIAMSFSMGAMMNFVVSKDMSPVYSEDFQRLRGMVIPVSWLKYVS